MIEIRYYTSKDAQEWNEFVNISREGTFLFQRGFMEYHNDRFIDASIICIEDKRWIGILPASAHKEFQTIRVHGGLTYGNLLTLSTITTEKTLSIWKAIANFYLEKGFSSLQIKPLPYIYHREPAEETLYWIFRVGGLLMARTLSSTVDFQRPFSLSTLRHRMYKKALHAGLQVTLFDRKGWLDFWEILAHVLKRHHTSPVHTIEEIETLAYRFPNSISLHTIHLDSEIIAGCVLFHTSHVTHVQYIATNEMGRKMGALDLLFSTLIERGISQYHSSPLTSPRYFDFGISTEKEGQKLNVGLLFHKEGFGAHSVCYDTYKINLSSFSSLNA